MGLNGTETDRDPFYDKAQLTQGRHQSSQLMIRPNAIT